MKPAATSPTEPRKPNPEAIAWSRGNRLVRLAGRNTARRLRPFRPQLVSDISAREIANYTTKRFTHEQDLWRVHIRTINGLLLSIDWTTRTGDKAVTALRWAGLLFLAGLLAAGLALGILIVEVTF